MILPLFIPKDNIDEYLNNNFNLAIFDSLEPFESQEEGINRLMLFNQLYEQYGIVEANKSKPNSIVNHLLKLDLPVLQQYLLFILLVSLIEAGDEEATNDLQDNSMHICKALILKEANMLFRKMPAPAPDLDAAEVPMLPEGYYWMKDELEKLPDFTSKMTFLMKAKAEYLRNKKEIIYSSPGEVLPNEVYDIEMNLLKSLEELKTSAGIAVKPVVEEPAENIAESDVSNNTIKDEPIQAPPFPDPKLHQTRKSIEAEFDLMHKNQRWEYAFTYESDYNTFVEILVKFFEAQPYEIPRKILRLKNDTKSRVGRVLRNLHKDLKFDGLNLREDKVSTNFKDQNNLTRFLISTSCYILTTILVFIAFLTNSCRRDNDQSYRNFDEYNTASLRQKSCFPDLISVNCYDIKVLQYLDERDTTNYVFGVFSYYDTPKMDSVLMDNVYKRISVESLQYCLESIPSSGIPNWFINGDRIKSSNIYLNERFFIIDNKLDKQIYFVYDGSLRLYNTSDNKASKIVSLN